MEWIGRHQTNNIAGSRSTIWDLSKAWFDNTYDSALSWVRRSPNATLIITRRNQMARREDERQSSMIKRLASTCIKCITARGEEVTEGNTHDRKDSVCTAAAKASSNFTIRWYLCPSWFAYNLFLSNLNRVVPHVRATNATWFADI